jgi:hypothetical protein
MGRTTTEEDTMKTMNATEIYAIMAKLKEILDGSYQELEDGDLTVLVEDEDPDDGRTAVEAMIEGWGPEIASLFERGVHAEWTGEGNEGESEIRLTFL